MLRYTAALQRAAEVRQLWRISAVSSFFITHAPVRRRFYLITCQTVISTWHMTVAGTLLAY